MRMVPDGQLCARATKGAAAPASSGERRDGEHGSPRLRLSLTDQRTAGASRRPESSSAQEGVCLALLAEGAHKSVAAEEGDLIAERQQLLFDRADERGVIAVREVGASDRAAEEDIADDREGLAAVDEDDAAGRVPGAMQHVKHKVADRERVTLLEPAIRRDRSRIHFVASAGLGQAVEQIFVLAVRAFDRHAEALLQLRRPPGMVDVAMSEDDLLDGDTGVLDRAEYAREIAAGIDDRRALAGSVPNQRAVLLERR